MGTFQINHPVIPLFEIEICGTNSILNDRIAMISVKDALNYIESHILLPYVKNTDKETMLIMISFDLFYDPIFKV